MPDFIKNRDPNDIYLTDQRKREIETYAHIIMNAVRQYKYSHANDHHINHFLKFDHTTIIFTPVMDKCLDARGEGATYIKHDCFCNDLIPCTFHWIETQEAQDFFAYTLLMGLTKEVIPDSRIHFHAIKIDSCKKGFLGLIEKSRLRDSCALRIEGSW